MADRVFFFRVDVYNIGNEEKKRERERKKEKCRFLRYNQLVRVVADIRAQRYPDNRSQMRVARCGNTPPPFAPPTLQPSTALSPSLRSTNKFVAPRYPDFNVFRYGASPSTPPIIIWRRVQLRRRKFMEGKNRTSGV